MKNFVLLSLIIMCSTAINSQVVLQENFTKPFNSSLQGWKIKNLSQTPAHNTTWIQGASMWFPAYNGGPDDYFCSSFIATNANTPATISAWLLTPTVALINGSVFEFVSRTVSNPATFADRLEVYMSTAGTGTDVGTTYTSVGTFSTLLVSINPSLTVTDYPDVWTVYSTTISGLTNNEVGRFGFRYHVTNGGGSPQAVNSEFVGIDAVKYTLPCKVAVNSYTTCAGQSITLTALDAAAGSSFSWTPGVTNSSSVVITPTATIVYTLNYDVSNLNCPALTSTVTVSSQLNVHVSASSFSFCEGGMATLTASGAATSYTWINNSLNSAVISVTPNTTTIYTVAGSSENSPGNVCAGSGTVQIKVYPNPVLNATLSRTMACKNETVLVSVSGADSYTWTGIWNAMVSSFVFKTGFSVGGKNFFVEGTSAHGCTSSTALLIKVDECVALSEEEVTKDEILAYPNPFTSNLHIKSTDGTLAVYNMLGQKIMEQESAGETYLDTKALPAGTYFVELKSAQHSDKKLLKVVKITPN